MFQKGALQEWKVLQGGRKGRWQRCRFIVQAQFSSCYLSSCELLKTIGMHMNLNKRNK